MEIIWVFLIFQSYINFGHSLLWGCSYPNQLGWSWCAGLAECWLCTRVCSRRVCHALEEYQKIFIAGTKRLKKQCHHLHLKQKFSSWFLTFLYSSEKSEKPSWFLRCHEKRFLIQPYKSALELQLKNKKMTALSACLMWHSNWKLQLPLQMLIVNCWRGRNLCTHRERNSCQSCQSIRKCYGIWRKPAKSCTLLLFKYSAIP